MSANINWVNRTDDLVADYYAVRDEEPHRDLFVTHRVNHPFDVLNYASRYPDEYPWPPLPTMVLDRLFVDDAEFPSPDLQA